jgi:transcriptional regulator with XRE-family HTH domain
MLTRSQFAAWLQSRRDAGETLSAIGARFGVSHVTVTHWLSGKRNPSKTVLVLAGELSRTLLDMAPGLPGPQEPLAGARTHLSRSSVAAMEAR